MTFDIDICHEMLRSVSYDGHKPDIMKDNAQSRSHLFYLNTPEFCLL